MSKLKIAIDGTAGSGKTTTSLLLAQKLGYTPIETGAMYRAITYGILGKGISPDNEKKVNEFVQNAEIKQVFQNGKLKTLLNGEDVTLFLYLPEVEKFVSLISSYKFVREHLVAIQREMAQNGGVVMEGRDIGTVVLLDADVKIFMDAKPEVRSERRLKELRLRGINLSTEEMHNSLILRDIMDTSRETSPLEPAKDAIFIDTSALSIEEQVEKVMKIIQKRQERRLLTE